MDWGQWSREAVSLMRERNDSWMKKFRLESTPFRWNLEAATLVFEAGKVNVVARICLVGTTSRSDGSFLWSWGNKSISNEHKAALEVVRKFGEENDLSLLTTPEFQGGNPEALECMCIAGKLQNALGTFSHEVGDIGVYFTILNFQTNS